jgi:hypothetical protein
MRIKIRDWDLHFEADRSRQWKKLSWVPVPNKQGLGYKKIMLNKNGAQIFGCWNALVQQASLCSPRGDLSKYTIDDLSTNTMIPLNILTEAISFILQHLDWIEVVENLDINVNGVDKNVSDPPVVSSLLCSSILSSSCNLEGMQGEKEKIFDEFRKKYPGTKRGNKTEYENFCKKHRDHNTVLSLLLPALDNQSAWRVEMSGAGQFVPEWKNLQTWINQRCWEMEKPLIEFKKPKHETQDEMFDRLEREGKIPRIPQ